MSKKKLGSFNDWINAYFQSFICLLPHDIFLPASLSKFPWRFWTGFSQSWNNLRKTLQSHENLWSLTDLSGANIGFHSNSRDRLVLVFMMSKINPWMKKVCCFGKMCKQHSLSLAETQFQTLNISVLHMYRVYLPIYQNCIDSVVLISLNLMWNIRNEVNKTFVRTK